MGIVYASNLVTQLREELLSNGISPDNYKFRFDGVHLEFEKLNLTTPSNNLNIKQDFAVMKKLAIISKNTITSSLINKNTISDLIRIMEEKNLSQCFVANMMGCSDAHVSNILNRKVKIKSYHLQDIIHRCILAEPQTKYKRQTYKPRKNKIDHLAPHRDKHLTKIHGELVPKNEVEQLSQLINKTNISVTELTILADLSMNTIDKWLRGKSNPRRIAFNKVMNVFNQSDFAQIKSII